MIPSEPLQGLTAQQQAILALDEWVQTPRGKYFLEREQAWLDYVVSDIFGFRAVQLGLAELDALRESRIPHKSFVAPVELSSLRQAESVSVSCYAHFDQLPFESQSIDLLVLPHVLEFSRNPHQVLREAERVLMPEGRLIVTGLNPMSLWGLHNWIFQRWWPVWPKSCSPVHLLRLKDWLKLLSLEPEAGRFGGYRFPAFSAKGLSRMGFMEKAGDRWWPVCGGVYYLCAVKRIQGMQLVGPAFKKKPASLKQQLKPAAQQAARKRPTIDL